MNRNQWLVITFLFLSSALVINISTNISYYVISPTITEVEEYFEENKCNYCSGDVYGKVYQMRRETGMLWGQIFKIPTWWIFPKFTLYITTPFNYYHEIDHAIDEFHTYTWVDTRNGRLVYNAVTGEYIKEINKTINPIIKYHKDMDDYVHKMKALQENAECSFNAYDCKDFDTRAEAQVVMFYCKSKGMGDIHYLDGDKDGIACETYFEKSNLNFGLLG